MHGVGFFDNPGLCYTPFSVNWDDILEYPDLQPVLLVPMNNRAAVSQWIAACTIRYNDEPLESQPTTLTFNFEKISSEQSAPSELTTSCK